MQMMNKICYIGVASNRDIIVIVSLIRKQSVRPVIVQEEAITLECGKWLLNTLRPRQNGHHFADDIFKCIFLNENVWIPIKISLKFVPKGPIDNIPALVQIMVWRRPGDKPLSEPMMVSLPTHICVTRPQGVKGEQNGWNSNFPQNLPLQWCHMHIHIWFQITGSANHWQLDCLLNSSG